LHSGRVRGLARLAHLGRSDKPIAVGPWVSEVGFESLYWVPMLSWFVQAYEIDPQRIVAFSRGGPESWYAGIAGRYVDVFDHVSPAELKRRQEARVQATRNEKQFEVDFFERELLASAGLDQEYQVLSPAVMYGLFWSYWAQRGSIRNVLERTAFEPFGGTGAAAPGGLPADYVAVKAYFSRCFPDTEGNRRFLDDLLTRLSAKHDVVLLGTGIDVDEHPEYGSSGSERIHDVTEHMRPRDNLDVQSAIVRGARALYTTYGGFAHLGPFLGAPTCAFYSADTFNAAHLDVTGRAVAALRPRTGAGFTLQHVDDLMLSDGLAGALREVAR
jgi:hypothetical protein